MSKRRGHGEAAIYKQCPTHGKSCPISGCPKGRWRGAVDLGWQDGKRQRKLVSGRTRNEVVAKLRKLHEDLERGVTVDARMTVGDWLDRYVETVIPGRSRVNDEKTVEQYRQMLRVHIKPALGAVKLADLTAEMVDDFLVSKSHLAKTYAGRMRSFLIAAGDHAVKRNKVRRNEAALSVMPRCKETTPRRPMTPEQVSAFETAARGERLEALFTMAFDNGLRPGEMIGITWEDLELAAQPPTLSLSGSVHLEPRQRDDREEGESQYQGYSLVRGKVKRSTNPNRTVELSPAAVDALKAHKARQAAERLKAGPLWRGGVPGETGLVFCTEIGTLIDPANLRRTFARIAKKAGSGHVFPYAIRHTTASLLIDAGASVEEVADLFGDDPITLYRHYRHQVKKVASAGTRMRGLLAPALEVERRS